jgi:hypothetical protein
LAFCCSEENDLLKVLKDIGFSFRRSLDLKALIEGSEEGSGILVLSDEYPRQTVEIDQETLKLAEQKALRVYIEYP